MSRVGLMDEGRAKYIGVELWQVLLRYPHWTWSIEQVIDIMVFTCHIYCIFGKFPTHKIPSEKDIGKRI